MKKDTEQFDILYDIAISVPPFSGAQIAASIVIKNRLISIGTNTKKTDPFHTKFSKHKEKIYLHAETCAIKNALKKIKLEDFSKATLYILRVKKNGEWGLAKPCTACKNAIVQFNIKRVVYSTNKTGVYNTL